MIFCYADFEEVGYYWHLVMRPYAYERAGLFLVLWSKLAA